MNMIFDAVMKAAQQKGLSLDHLDFSSAIDQTETIYHFIKMYGERYDTTISFTKDPKIGVAARLNGFPVILGFAEEAGKLRLYEIPSGGMDAGDYQIAVIPGAVITDLNNPDKGLTGKLRYNAISRQESVALDTENPNFGTLELQIMLGYILTDVEVKFTLRESYKKLFTEPNAPGRWDDVFSGLTARSVGNERSFNPTASAPSSPSYTAGRTTVEDVRTERIETIPWGFYEVLARDVFCLVHREEDVDAPVYS
jgi:hypothetical protein